MDEKVIRAVEQRCEREGLRLTPTRRRVLEMMLEVEGPVKAYDLLDKLKVEQPSAAPPTVYRALDFLLEHHFIHRLESLNAFVSCGHPEDHHHGYFLICDDCDSVSEIPDKRLSSELSKHAAAAGFQTERQVIEVHGQCDNCRPDSNSSKKS